MEVSSVHRFHIKYDDGQILRPLYCNVRSTTTMRSSIGGGRRMRYTLRLPYHVQDYSMGGFAQLSTNDSFDLTNMETASLTHCNL